MTTMYVVQVQDPDSSDPLELWGVAFETSGAAEIAVEEAIKQDIEYDHVGDEFAQNRIAREVARFEDNFAWDSQGKGGSEGGWDGKYYTIHPVYLRKE